GFSWCWAWRRCWHRTRTRRVRHTHLGTRRRSRCQRSGLSSSVLSSSLASCPPPLVASHHPWSDARVGVAQERLTHLLKATLPEAGFRYTEAVVLGALV